MKCKFIHDVDVQASALPESEKAKVKMKQVKSRRTGKMRWEAYFPAGTIYEHPNAAHFVDCGMAIPEDPECEAACKPMTEEQRISMQNSAQCNALGIHDDNDRELFALGFIAGYEKVDGKDVYIPGPNYAQWEADRKASATTLSKDSEI